MRSFTHPTIVLHSGYKPGVGAGEPLEDTMVLDEIAKLIDKALLPDGSIGVAEDDAEIADSDELELIGMVADSVTGTQQSRTAK